MAGVPALQEPSRLAQVPLPTLINKVYIRLIYLSK